MFRKKRDRSCLFFSIGVLALLLPGCKPDDSPVPDFNVNDIFFDYQINGRESDDKLTLLMQFREGCNEGTGISIGNWGTLTLDGSVVPGDSAKRTGYFYETHLPVDNFLGKHTILLSSGDKKKEYKVEFDFQQVELLTAIPDTLTRGDLVLDFSGLETKDYLRVLLVDTSVINDGINRVDTVQNGRLVITADDLKKLDNGLVQLLFFRELERPLKNGTPTGGRLLITYSLGREFYLMD